jgi:hypothetical protein
MIEDGFREIAADLKRSYDELKAKRAKLIGGVPKKQFLSEMARAIAELRCNIRKDN